MQLAPQGDIEKRPLQERHGHLLDEGQRGQQAAHSEAQPGQGAMALLTNHIHMVYIYICVCAQQLQLPAPHLPVACACVSFTYTQGLTLVEAPPGGSRVMTSGQHRWSTPLVNIKS